MAKPKSPLLSLGARGTIGDALTYQKRGQDTIVRQKPIPRDPYSLNQAYQRWDYRDYAYLWTLLTNSEKQIYRTRASKYHITGFSLWMRERLNELTNLAGRWHLDEKTGAVAYDSSRNTNNGVIYGATPADGIISGAFLFDGLNDVIIVPDHPTLNFTESGQFSLEAFIKVNVFPVTDWDGFVSKGDWQNYGMSLRFTKKIRCVVRTDGVSADILGATILSTGIWYHVLLTAIAGGDGVVYLNGVEDGRSALGAGALLTTAHPLWIGHSIPGWFDGLIDQVALYDTILDETLIKRHSERRYPV